LDSVKLQDWDFGCPSGSIDSITVRISPENVDTDTTEVDPNFLEVDVYILDDTGTRTGNSIAELFADSGNYEFEWSSTGTEMVPTIGDHTSANFGIEIEASDEHGSWSVDLGDVELEISWGTSP